MSLFENNTWMKIMSPMNILTLKNNAIFDIHLDGQLIMVTKDKMTISLSVDALS